MFAELDPFAESAISDARAAVARAMAELRRGADVIVDAPGRVPLLIRAVEASDAADVARYLGFGPAQIALTPRRAAALGLIADGARPGAVLATAGDPTLVAALGNADATTAPAIPVEAAPEGGAEDAALALAKLARLLPVLLVVALDGAPPPDVLRVAASDVAAARAAAGDLRPVADAAVPLDGAADARIYAFRPWDGGREHLAILVGSPPEDRPVLARLHSECLTGDLLGSLRCDCGEQLRGAIAAIAAAGGGVLLYLAQEGRGIGLVNKLRAYRLQDAGFDTIDANERLGFDADERDYAPAAAMLRALGFGAVRLMTNNPDKLTQLARHGVTVAERVPHAFPANGHNELYLKTKAARAGHLLPLGDGDSD